MADNSNSFGSFIPTTNIWDTAEIFDVDINSIQFRELLVRLYQNINNIALVVNTKDTGIYTNTAPFVNGQTWFADPALTSVAASNRTTPTERQVVRTVINFGALPNTATKSVAHNIICNASTTFTRIYATASDTTGFNYIPIPYASPVLANNIEINVDATNVNITTGSNRTNFNICYVILEYLLL